MRAAAGMVTGCPLPTPSHAMMAEAGIAPVAERRLAQAARLLAKACALPEDDLLRVVAEAPARLSTVTGRRSVGREAWRAAVFVSQIEPILSRRYPLWEPPPPVSVTFGLDLGVPLPPAASDHQRQEAAALHLAALPRRAKWMWTDGSAAAGVSNGGTEALIVT